MKFGYARVSKNEQNLDLQLDALRKYGVDEIFEEKISSKNGNRPQLTKLLDLLRTGDMVVIYRLDRLGRTVKQLLELVESFDKRGIHFVSLNENLDTTTAMGKFCFHMFCSVAQMERDVISERTKAGLESARARGRTGGRKPADRTQIQKAKKMYKSGEFSIKEILELTGIKKSTFYKYLNMPTITDNKKNDVPEGQNRKEG